MSRVRKDDTGEFPSPLEPVTRSDRRWGVALAIMLLVLAHFMWDPGSAEARPCHVPAGVKVKGEVASAEQRRNTTVALRLADRMKAPWRHKVAVVAGATQEDSQYNRRRGHGTSVGYLQLTNIHGTPKYSVSPEANIRWRMQVRNSAGWFLRGARKIDPRGRAPLATTRGRWGLIQRIQRSGHPYAYNRWIRESARTVRAYNRTCKGAA